MGLVIVRHPIFMLAMKDRVEFHTHMLCGKPGRYPNDTVPPPPSFSKEKRPLKSLFLKYMCSYPILKIIFFSEAKYV